MFQMISNGPCRAVERFGFVLRAWLDYQTRSPLREAERRENQNDPGGQCLNQLPWIGHNVWCDLAEMRMPWRTGRFGSPNEEAPRPVHRAGPARANAA